MGSFFIRRILIAAFVVFFFAIVTLFMRDEINVSSLVFRYDNAPSVDASPAFSSATETVTATRASSTGVIAKQSQEDVQNIVRITKSHATQQPLKEKIVSMPGPLVAEEKQFDGVVQPLVSSQIVALTNIERAKSGMQPLAKSPRLSAIAEAKALDMIAQEYFAHIAPDGTDINALAEKYGYQFLNIGENLALGDFDSNEGVVYGWMNSPGHRANILNKQFTEIGVAALGGVRNGKNVWYVVQEFGRPLSDCRGIEPLLEEKIAIYQGEIAALETTLKNLYDEIESSEKDESFIREKIKDYNAIVELYNGVIEVVKVDIGKYNMQARAFNICAGHE